MTVKITVLPSEDGSPVTKSIAIWEQGRRSVGYAGNRVIWTLAKGLLFTLLRAQVRHAATYSCMSAVTEG